MKAHSNLYRVFFLIVALTSIVACGQVNDDASLVNNTGQHSANWITLHGSDTALSVSSCTHCHGADLTGGISKVGCFSTAQMALNGIVCHATSPAVDTGCKSCHRTPPNGTVAPNRDFAHGVHLSLAGVDCATCHANAGAGTVNHAKATAIGGIARATVSPLSDVFKAKTTGSTFGYDPASETCSSIICHGGKTAPSWSTGTINIATDCLKCHEQGTAPQTPQYNSFYSGVFPFSDGSTVNLHQLHLSARDPYSISHANIFCTNCHNTDKLAAQHFNGLTTPAFEGIPGNIPGGGTTRISSYIPYTSTIPSGTCTNQCHAVRNWIN